jgi:hypothetical protein
MLREFCKQLDRMGFRSVSGRRATSSHHYHVDESGPMTRVSVGGTNDGVSIWYFDTKTGNYLSHRTSS